MKNRIHIIGRKNSGKTTLVVELVEWFKKHGYRVGTIKHTHHHHELDTPGKDSFRHREAGANAVGILSPSLNAMFWSEPKTNDSEKESEARYEMFRPLMEPCDLVLVEGDSKTTATKLEVWRAENTAEPMLLEDKTIAAIVTDDQFSTDRPTLPRSEISVIATWIAEQAGIKKA